MTRLFKIQKVDTRPYAKATNTRRIPIQATKFKKKKKVSVTTNQNHGNINTCFEAVSVLVTDFMLCKLLQMVLPPSVQEEVALHEN